MAPPPTLPADLARRAEPPTSPVQRSRDIEAAQQLSAMLTATQRIEQSAQANATNLQELRGELRGELQTLRAQMRDVLPPRELAAPPPLLTPPPPVATNRVASAAAVIAAIAALGALAGSALVIREQKQQQTSLTAVAATTQTLGLTVAHLGESMAAPQPPGAGADDHAAGKSAPNPDGGSKPSDSPAADGKTPVCPPPAEGAGNAKARVLLPNLVGLRLGEARTAVAPLQLQLLPTDKKLKEASKIGWQLPNPGAELEPDEAVTVALKPPVQKKKKKG